MSIDFKALPDPILRFDVMTNHFVLVEDYVTPEITVPAGEYTDGCTRPELLNIFCKQYDRCLPAAIVHDHMYRYAIGTKEEADELFGKNLRRLEIPEAKVTAMVAAVKLGGEGSYK